MHDLNLAVAQHAGGRGGHFLQGLDGLFGLALLVHAQHRVDDHDGQDDDHVGEAFALYHSQYAADGCRRQQDQDHGVHQLVNEALEQGILLALGELVLAAGFQAAGRFVRGEAAFRGGNFLQYLFCIRTIVFHGGSPLCWDQVVIIVYPDDVEMNSSSTCVHLVLFLIRAIPNHMHLRAHVQVIKETLIALSRMEVLPFIG